MPRKSRLPPRRRGFIFSGDRLLHHGKVLPRPALVHQRAHMLRRLYEILDLAPDHLAVLHREIADVRPPLRRAHLVHRVEFDADIQQAWRSEEHTSALQSLMRISYAVFCFKKKHKPTTYHTYKHTSIVKHTT